MAKAELAKLGIVRADQLEQPLPPGLIADVQVVQRTADDGTDVQSREDVQGRRVRRPRR